MYATNLVLIFGTTFGPLSTTKSDPWAQSLKINLKNCRPGHKTQQNKNIKTQF